MAQGKKANGVKRAARELSIVAPEETADLKFRVGGMVSPYRDLLEDLQEAKAGSTLKIQRAARYTAVKWIRDLGLKVLWGKKGEFLYIKIVGECERPLTIERAVDQAVKGNVKALEPFNKVIAAVKDASPDGLLIRTLKANGPGTLKELARVLGCTPVACASRLTPLVDSGRLEMEEGVYRVKAG